MHKNGNGFPKIQSMNNRFNLFPRRTLTELAEWHSGCVSALPCERPGFASRTRLREIIPANNCTMQGQNNWGNWGSPGCDEALSGMGGASLTNEVPGVM